MAPNDSQLTATEIMPKLQTVKRLIVRTATLVCLLAVSSMLLVPVQGAAIAQGGGSPWEEPRFLTPDPGPYRVRPFIAADLDGDLHAIWHEGEEMEGTGQRIIEVMYYSYYDGTQWSMPVDIVAAQSDSEQGLTPARGLVATPDGRLLVIRSEDGFVVISQAPKEEATNARAWSSVRVDAGVNPTLAVSRHGQTWCHASWRDGYTSLFLSCSHDQGDTWDPATFIWSAPPDAAGNNVDSLFAADGQVHLAWSEPTERRNWSSEAIWHAVVDPRSDIVSVREVMRSISSEDPTLDTPALAECPDAQVHIFWNNGVGSTTGRFHQHTLSGSDAWSDVAPVFPGLSGLTSKAGLVCDNTGRVHVITAAAGAGTSTSPLRYATWSNGAWSDYRTLWDGRCYGERPSMAIAGGNQLHVVWDAFSGTNQIGGRFIAHADHAIDAAPIARATPSPDTVPTSSVPQAGTDSSDAQAITPQTPSESLPDLAGSPSTKEFESRSPFGPVALSASLVVLLLALVFWGSRMYGRR